MRPFSFKSSERLLKRADFEELSRRSYRIESEFLLVLYFPNNIGRSRLGVTVSRKVGGAAVRNRIKRLVREHFRKHKALLSDCYDVNIIARREISGLSPRQTWDALQHVLGRIMRNCENAAASTGTH